MKRIAFLPVLISMCILSACSADSSSSANAFTRVEEPHNSAVLYGYDSNGQLVGDDKQEFDDCRYDVYRYYDDLELENDFTRAYEYMGLAGKSGAYLFYGYYLYFPVKKTYSFKFMDYTCQYQEIWTVSTNGKWRWNCNFSNTVTYSSYVGNSGQQTLPAGTKTIMEKTYSMIPTEITGKDAPTLVLYSEDTYIDVYVSGSLAHFIQRLPSYEDLGVFYSK